MVTAEFAVALPALVMVVLAAVCAVITVTDQLRCADAAAIAARLAARGEPAAVVRSVALRAAPRGARLELLTTATTVTATVTTRLTPPGFLRHLPAIVTREQVAAAREGNVTRTRND
jgi:Kef-type K+ transport system membrane component KefB